MVFRVLIAATLLAAIWHPATAAPVNDAAILAGTPPKSLSEYRLFIDGTAQTPNDSVLPYDLNTPLFSDYALKFRFFYMPSGTPADYDADTVFAFPVGTVLVKTFAYPADMRAPDEALRLLETRLLIHKETGWVALPYVWNDEMSEAVLKKAGARIPVSWVHTDGRVRETRYRVPNVNQCKGCHATGKNLTPIGPKARNLNKAFAYSGGRENQLTRWTETGYLRGAPEPAKAPRMPRWDDPSSGSLDARARAYLDVNCAHCHGIQGAADTSGLFLDVTEAVPIRYGVYKRPVAAGRGSGGYDFDIAPGKPDESILTFRMIALDPGIMMPEMGRTLAHDEAVALIREWIDKMEDYEN